jgi:hypothetical protein
MTDPGIIYVVLVLLNLALLAALYIFGVPKAQAQLMQRRSGKGYNREYEHQRGRKNDLRIPSLKFVDRKTRVQWPRPHTWLQRPWRHWIRGVWLFGLTHILGVATATSVALYLWFQDEGRRGSDNPIDAARGTVVTALVLMTVLYLLTHVYPRLGRHFRSSSYLLSGSVLVLWLFWAKAIFDLLSASEFQYLPLFAYAIVWLPLLVVPGVLRYLCWRGQLHWRMNLLVLRVFGSYKRSSFIFRVLQPLWNHVGGVFVVSSPDQSFLGPRGMSKFRLLAFGVLWVFLFCAQAVVPSTFAEHQGLRWAAVLMLPFVAHTLLYVPLLWVVNSSFMKDESDTYTPIVKNIQKHNLMGVHANTHVACHADDWKLAVGSFSSMSDCLLVDLRGFTAKNAGITYELSFVVNNIPLENVLGLADKTTDMTALTNVFADHWSHMVKQSVNYRSKSQALQIYKRDTIHSRDAFHVAAWLMSKGVRKDLLEQGRKQAEKDADSIPLFTWNRRSGSGKWMYLTWLPLNHPKFDKCPHGDIQNWQQAVDKTIKRPFTIKTQTLGPSENEADFWKGMAKLVRKKGKR